MNRSLQCLKLMVIMLCVLISACDHTQSVSVEPTPALTDIEQFAQFKYPRSASDIQTYSESGIDRLALVKFVIPSDDLNAFLLEAGYKSLREGYNPIGSYGQKGQAWWTPDASKIFAGQEQTAAGIVKRILVDKSNPNIYIIYLQCFSI